MCIFQAKDSYLSSPRYLMEFLKFQNVSFKSIWESDGRARSGDSGHCTFVGETPYQLGLPLGHLLKNEMKDIMK